MHTIIISLYHNEMMNLLVFTSTLFITNVLVGVYLEYHVYALLFFVLLSTSIINHSGIEMQDIKKWDRVAVISVGVYGAYMMIQKGLFNGSIGCALTIGCFLFCVLMYDYGSRINRYCFDENPFVSCFYHACMHLVGSVGHHFIMIL
jgi:hypothetical protein